MSNNLPVLTNQRKKNVMNTELNPEGENNMSENQPLKTEKEKLPLKEIEGNIGRVPVLKSLKTGDIASFSVAVSEAFMNDEGLLQERTQWFEIQAYGSLAKFCAENFNKGDRVKVRGGYRERGWEKDGRSGISHEILVNSKDGLIQWMARQETPHQPSSEILSEKE